LQVIEYFINEFVLFLFESLKRVIDQYIQISFKKPNDRLRTRIGESFFYEIAETLSLCQLLHKLQIQTRELLQVGVEVKDVCTSQLIIN